MKWADMTPLFTAILAFLFVLGILVLALFGKPIPQVLVLGATSAISVFFISSAARGSSPPPGGGPNGK